METQSKLGYYNNINIPIYSFYTTNLSTYQLVNYSYQLPNNSFIVSSPIDETTYYDKKTPAILMTDNNSNILPLTYTLEGDNMFTVEPKTNTIKFDKLTNTLNSINEKLNNLQNSNIILSNNSDNTYNIVFINNDFKLSYGLCYNKIIYFNGYKNNTNHTSMGDTLNIKTNSSYYATLKCNTYDYINYYISNKSSNYTIFTYRNEKRYLIIPISYNLQNVAHISVCNTNNQWLGYLFGKNEMINIVDIPPNNKLCFEINSSNNDYINSYIYVGNVNTMSSGKLYAIMINDDFFTNNSKESPTQLNFTTYITAPFIFNREMSYGYLESNTIKLDCEFTYTIPIPTSSPDPTSTVTPSNTPSSSPL
jgi:hypothetical protein